ncbi:hypothetical protein Z517_05633 [Fonsecaea pedrosoi CBS 271.37]|uniref:Uncharacterized protein n=1 Tax=Fonsecaea pedrosoi CBS 271.37 TaxID=1442368 RepID=A0A0D2DXU3_9EURO|nr:uncharacterized protein Z517_05633 [Fonsecaea pedrosoi CBS 271.37]KIW82606.1 hypothetical protein Z517_05633 [Fonsecaea pedrosoi CBS 271.37]
MEQFRISFSTPNDALQPLAMLTGRMIDSPSSELEIRYPVQMGNQTHRPVTTPMGPAYAFQQATWSPLFDQGRIGFASDNSQTSLSHRQTSNSHAILATIIGRRDIAIFRDTVCSYLRLTSALWTELYNPREYSTAHHLLTRYLCQEYGRLPPDLWRLVNELREQYGFEHSRFECIDIISSIPTPPDLISGGLEAAGHGVRDFGDSCNRPVPRASEGNSSLASHVSSPGPGPGSQTRSTTPVSMVGGRKKFQSPTYQRAKGRAPKGERYKCPYMNCRHDAFRNAGNFSNHMRNCHAESEYRNRNPAEFLVPDSSPQPSNQGDTTSSVVTSASDSPLTQRRLSQESYGGENEISNAGQDGVRYAGDFTFTTDHNGFQISMSQGVFDESSPGPSGSSGLSTTSLLEAFSFDPSNPGSRLVTSQHERNHESCYPLKDEAEYGQFQMMEDQRWKTRPRG